MRKILVPTDGSDNATKAVELASDLAVKHGAKLQLLHVLLRDKQPADLRKLVAEVPLSPDLQAQLEESQARVLESTAPEWAQVLDPESLPNALSDQVLEALGHQVLTAAEALAKHKGVAEVAVEMDSGDAVARILEVAARDQVDSIVMGHRGLREIEAVAFGSVSNKVSHDAPCSVIMIK